MRGWTILGGIEGSRGFQEQDPGESGGLVQQIFVLLDGHLQAPVFAVEDDILCGRLNSPDGHFDFNFTRGGALRFAIRGEDTRIGTPPQIRANATGAEGEMAKDDVVAVCPW